MPDPITVLRDRDVDLKWLELFEKESLIVIYEVDLDQVPKRSKRVLSPLWILGKSHLTRNTVLGNEKQQELYQAIKRIISSGGHKDMMTIETAARHSMLYFVTEDHDFLDKLEDLQQLLPGLKVVAPDELEQILIHKRGEISQTSLSD